MLIFKRAGITCVFLIPCEEDGEKCGEGGKDGKHGQPSSGSGAADRNVTVLGKESTTAKNVGTSSLPVDMEAFRALHQFISPQCDSLAPMLAEFVNAPKSRCATHFCLVVLLDICVMACVTHMLCLAAIRVTRTTAISTSTR